MTMTRTWARAALSAIALTAAALLLGAAAPVPANVDGARLAKADAEPGQWMAPGRTYDEQRFSPLTQVNEQTVGKLGLAWYADLPVDLGVEASPLMVDGVLYDITAWNVTTAYDAKTGRLLWTYDPKVPQEFGRLACCDIDSRGLAATLLTVIGMLVLAGATGPLLVGAVSDALTASQGSLALREALLWVCCVAIAASSIFFALALPLIRRNDRLGLAA